MSFLWVIFEEGNAKNDVYRLNEGNNVYVESPRPLENGGSSPRIRGHDPFLKNRHGDSRRR